MTAFLSPVEVTNFLQEVRGRMRMLGLPEYVLAERMKVPPTALSRWLCGHVSPRIENLARIHQALKALEAEAAIDAEKMSGGWIN